MQLVISQPYLCVAAILETVLNDVGFESMDQLKIAEHFSVTVPLDYKGLIKNVQYSNVPDDFGISLRKDSINSFFKQYGIPLEEKYVSILTLNDWEIEEYVNSNLLLNKYIICGYDYAYLYKTGGNKSGHVSLITKKLGNRFLLLDPGPDDHGEKSVDIDDLYLAIKAKKDGLWIISRK